MKFTSYAAVALAACVGANAIAFPSFNFLQRDGLFKSDPYQPRNVRPMRRAESQGPVTITRTAAGGTTTVAGSTTTITRSANVATATAFRTVFKTTTTTTTVPVTSTGKATRTVTVTSTKNVNKAATTTITVAATRIVTAKPKTVTTTITRGA